MSDDPVVETINAILNGEDNFILLVQRPQLERFRDEIVALREQLDHAATHGSGFTGILAGAVSAEAKRWVKEASVQVRDEALEEAVRAIDGISWDWPSPRFDDAEAFKAAIRALKEKGRDPR